MWLGMVPIQINYRYNCRTPNYLYSLNTNINLICLFCPVVFSSNWLEKPDFHVLQLKIKYMMETLNKFIRIYLHSFTRHLCSKSDRQNIILKERDIELVKALSITISSSYDHHQTWSIQLQIHGTNRTRSQHIGGIMTKGKHIRTACMWWRQKPMRQPPLVVSTFEQPSQCIAVENHLNVLGDWGVCAVYARKRLKRLLARKPTDCYCEKGI